MQIINKTHTKGPLPLSFGQSSNLSEPKEKRQLEDHSFEMILRPKPKKPWVTAYLHLVGFNRVILDWPMLARPVLDAKEKYPVVLQKSRTH